jgi:hypothetical protein
MKPPRLLGPIFCREISYVPGAAVMSLEGVFNGRSYSRWPSPADRFLAYALLIGGEGEGRMELTIIRAQTEQLIYRHERWYAVPAPDVPVHFEMTIRRCVFPTPGRYLVALRFEGEILAQRHLDVRQQPATP